MSSWDKFLSRITNHLFVVVLRQRLQQKDCSEKRVRRQKDFYFYFKEDFTSSEAFLPNPPTTSQTAFSHHGKTKKSNDLPFLLLQIVALAPYIFYHHNHTWQCSE